jgi:Gpi18-like mannosyltransferase
MSNLLNDLKTISQNSPQKINQDNDVRSQQQNDYSDYDYSIQNIEPQEVLKPTTIYDKSEDNIPVEIKNIENNYNDNNSQETSTGYGYTNFGQENQFQEESTVKKSLSFLQTQSVFEEKSEPLTFIPPILPSQNSQKFSLDEQILPNKTIKKTNLSFFLKVIAYLKLFFTIENILFGIIILLTLRIRFAFFPFQTNDYNSFLKPWMQYIVDHGSFEAFRVKFYDYTPAYLYLLWIGTIFNANFLFWIKSISVFFDFVMAYYVGKIAAIKYPKVFKMAFLVTLMAPAVIFNGSLWGQVDVMYSSMVMVCLFYILTNSHVKAAFFFAIGLCLKLQSMFFAPVFLWLLVTKNIPKKFVVTLAALFIGLYLLMILPISQGVIFQNNPLDSTKNARPLFDSTSTVINGAVTETKDTRDGLLTIYANQPKNYSHIVMGPASSMYQWVDDKNYEYFYQNGLTIAIVVVLLLAYYLVSNKIVNVDNDVIVKMALISTLAIPFLLPKMHERYFFLADVMALVYAFWFPKKFWVGVVIAFISFTVYIQAVIGGNIPEIFQQQYNALWVMLILIYLIYDLIKGLRASYKLTNKENE